MIRASSMPRFIECASSEARAEGEVHHDETHPEARLGTAVHEALALLVEGKRVDLAAIAQKHDADARDVGKLFAYGRKVWREISQWLPEPHAEQELEGPVSRGTTDVIHHDGTTGVVVDWKSGWVRRSAVYQVMSYASAARGELGMPASGRMTAIVVWLRFGEYDVLNLTEQHIHDFDDMVRGRLRDVGKQYAVTEYCTFCPRRLTCRARLDYIQSTAALLEDHYERGDLVQTDTPPLTRAQLGRIYLRARMLESALKEYFKAVRLELNMNSEPISIDDARGVTLGKHPQYRIDARKAWPILEANDLDPAEINRALKVSKKKLEEIVMDKAPRGHKTKARDRLREELEQAGALHKTTYPKFQIVKATATQPIRGDHDDRSTERGAAAS